MLEYMILAAIVVIYLISFSLIQKKDQNKAQTEKEQLMERISELKESLERMSTVAQDRRESLNNKTKDIFEIQFKQTQLERELEKEKTKYATLLNQKKSTEVRVGQISEQIAPFMDAWPYKANNFRFLGSPVDGVSFEDDAMVVVEIKTGHGKLTPKQRQIRKHIREGKVKLVEFRIEPDGFKIKEG